MHNDYIYKLCQSSKMHEEVKYTVWCVCDNRVKHFSTYIIYYYV